MASLNKHSSILITGASSGIGVALAHHYAQPGVTLFLSARNSDRLSSTVKICQDLGATVYSSNVDVCDRFKMEDWINHSDTISPLDLVIANAGISGGSNNDSQSGDLYGETTRTLFATNLVGVLNTILPVMPLMIKRNRGQIAIVSSMAGFRGMASAPAYSASKAAVKAWGEGLRGELSNTGVKVNVICPGFVESRITDANSFPMPFLMKAPKAARIIARGLQRNTACIAFPFPTFFVMRLFSILPNFIVEPVMNRLPKKAES
jgi:short-subunit dehydrogenase